MSALEERAARLQRQAYARVEALVVELRREGWDFVAVQLSRVVSDSEEALVPGAAMFRATKTVGPALPREADTLRGLADGIDEEFRQLGCREATEGYRVDMPMTREVAQ